MPINTFGDIPDDFITKKHLPLGVNIWGMFKEYGWEYLQYLFKEFGRKIGDLEKIRLSESVFTAKDIMKDRTGSKKSEKILTYSFFPPTLAIRADLQPGTMKLLFGESSDTTFLILNDFDQDVLFALNTHIEDGSPQDWWSIVSGEDDDFFDRKHMKLGYKFRNIPKKSKNLNQAANRLIQVLRDVRNERTPQWNDSNYHIIIGWCSAVINMLLEKSNIEVLGCMHDGLASKDIYRLKNYWFNFFPAPTFMGTTGYMGRDRFIKMYAGLTTDSLLYLQPIEKEAHPMVNDLVPECFEFLENRWNKKGVYLPWQSVERRIPPNLKNIKKEENFSAQYPEDPESNLDPKVLDISFKESLKGVLLDIDFYTRKEDLSPDSIISTGYGRKTVFKDK
ncbi:MAG: hypothetical protein GF329_18595 [Candidatus Lokiarchaeota archaeon]|nr:hypothetical protein [Candidatus Lokiarchaeota archaeon]